MFPPPATIRVLLVDDEVVVQHLLQECLEDAGYEVVAADSVQQAMECLGGAAKGFGGLVTDINLGGDLSGWDVARRARRLNPHIPVVYISGDSGFEWSSLGVPNSAMLDKPFAPAQVVVALASLATKIDLRLHG